MATRSRVLTVAVVATGFAIGWQAQAQDAVPAGYPATYGSVITGARTEGNVAIYTSTDLDQSQPLMNAFRSAYPGITIEWSDLGTNGAYNRAISEAAANQMGADVVWTSAMDLQMNLVSRELVASYQSPEARDLPPWAVYRDMAYATTIEPAAFIYNRNLLPAQLVPRTRADFLRILRENRDTLRGKVATFDPERSGTGFLWSTNEARTMPDFWDYVRAFGGVEGRGYSSSGQIRERIVSGEHILAFNVIGSYALEWANQNPTIGVGFFSDFVPAFSRVAVITRAAPHPNAGRLFLDFMLSQAGQRALAQAGIPSVRSDIQGILNAETLNARVGGGLRPIALDERLTEYLEPTRRAEFFRQWRAAMRR